MNGLLIIDKPAGLTSHDVVRALRRSLRMRRIGHAGTLDPLATGVLPVAVGESTRLVQFLMEKDKTYRATLELGTMTDTQDVEGKVLERRPLNGLDWERIETVAGRFVGEIEQIPPMYSAVKKDGVPLHRLARRGIEVERQTRPVRIFRLEILAVELPRVILEVDCSKGTYVRTLCHDLGLALGCGAHLTALRRLRSGSFTLERCLSLEEVERRCREGLDLPLTTPEAALGDLPALEVSPEAAARLRHGIPPALDAVARVFSGLEGEKVALLDHGTLLAIARYAPSRLREKRGDFELLRVFPGAGEA